jgi:hypothetical protein
LFLGGEFIRGGIEVEVKEGKATRDDQHIQQLLASLNGRKK